MRQNLGLALRWDKEAECFWVDNRKMKSLLHARELTTDEVLKDVAAWTEGENRLRFGHCKVALATRRRTDRS